METDYVGYTREGFGLVEQKLIAAGYERSCTAFDDYLHGYSRGTERCAMKVDQFGDVAALSIFNADGSEPLMFLVCSGEAETPEFIWIK